ncbi:SDR family oxidoreductase [Zunongwangia sp.]|uniref:SDR family oxidoreductase n=1 Tax=Zunongwangia sp. TaxID=1965325 RepID=UPI003AA882BE
MEKILIAGATGNTGKRIVEILNSSESFAPVAMIRKEEQQQIFDDMGVKSVLADLEGDVNKAFEKVPEIDKVIFAAGSGSKTGADKTTSVDEEGAKKLIDAAKENKVKKFILLSSMGTNNPEEADESMQHYLKAKKAADEYLQASGLTYTIVRPGQLSDDMGIAKVKVAKQLGEYGEIPRDDVAFIMVMALADPLTKNMVFEAIEGETPIKQALIELSGIG